MNYQAAYAEYQRLYNDIIKLEQHDLVFKTDSNDVDLLFSRTELLLKNIYAKAPDEYRKMLNDWNSVYMKIISRTVTERILSVKAFVYLIGEDLRQKEKLNPEASSVSMEKYRVVSRTVEASQKTIVEVTSERDHLRNEVKVLKEKNSSLIENIVLMERQLREKNRPTSQPTQYKALYFLASFMLLSTISANLTYTFHAYDWKAFFIIEFGLLLVLGVLYFKKVPEYVSIIINVLLAIAGLILALK